MMLTNGSDAIDRGFGIKLKIRSEGEQIIYKSESGLWGNRQKLALLFAFQLTVCPAAEPKIRCQNASEGNRVILLISTVHHIENGTCKGSDFQGWPEIDRFLRILSDNNGPAGLINQ